MNIEKSAAEINTALANGTITPEQARTAAIATLVCYNQLAIGNVNPGSDIYFPTSNRPVVENIRKKPKGSSIGLEAVAVVGTDFSDCNRERVKKGLDSLLIRRTRQSEGMFKTGDKPPQISYICIEARCKILAPFLVALASYLPKPANPIKRLLSTATR